MKTKFKFIDPGAIMGVVVSLVILAVGVFAFYVTIDSISTSGNFTREVSRTMNNTSGAADSVFNILGIVLIIGAIMTIVGLVYNFIDSDYDRPKKRKKPRKEYHKHAVVNLDDPGPYTKSKKAKEKVRKELPTWENIDEEKVKSKKTKKQRGSFEEWK